MIIALIDNYDSFTWNLVQAVESLGASVIVNQNDDDIDLDDLAPDKIIISPGPGTPVDSGNSNKIIQQFMDQIMRQY